MEIKINDFKKQHTKVKMNELILTKDSSKEDIKAYFESVCKLMDTSMEEFPVNLDEVWPLVYAEKGAAVRALKNGFIENVDYKTFDITAKREIGATRVTEHYKKAGHEVFDTSAKNPVGGRPTSAYHLSVSCLEYFIARKARPIFEVYRQVFHKARRGEFVQNALPNPERDRVDAQIYLIEAMTRNLRLNDAARLAMYQQVAEQNKLKAPDYVLSKGIHKSAKDLLSEFGKPISVKAFNKKLIAKGFLSTEMRTSSNGTMKPFKNITEKGLRFGENVVSPQCPNSTQPHWYVDRFKELYDIVMEGADKWK